VPRKTAPRFVPNYRRLMLAIIVIVWLTYRPGERSPPSPGHSPNAAPCGVVQGGMVSVSVGMARGGDRQLLDRALAIFQARRGATGAFPWAVRAGKAVI
jgi:hypothetical protein